MRTKAPEFFRPAALDLEQVLQMKRRIPFIAALIAVLGIMVYIGSSWRGRTLRLPRIEMTSALTGSATSMVKPDEAEPIDGHTEARRPRPTGLLPWGNGSHPARVRREPERQGPKESGTAVPFWCFRTFYPGLPWMMSSHERNTGNSARSDSEFIWNGERSLRLNFVPVGDPLKDPPLVLNAQRNVLWQAIRAAPFHGKRIVFRPVLRAMPGGRITAFLRSWDGSTGSPLLAPDRYAMAATPTAMWAGAWGSTPLLIDVPPESKIIYYGIVQSGERPVWIDHVEISVDIMPGTLGIPANMSRHLEMSRYLENLPALPIDPNWVWDEPKNLDFETVYPDENAGTPDDTPPLPC
jgi:hypothetical protein